MQVSLPSWVVMSGTCLFWFGGMMQMEKVANDIINSTSHAQYQTRWDILKINQLYVEK